MTTLLEQADAAIYAAIRPNHQYQVKDHRVRTLTTLWGDVTFSGRIINVRQIHRIIIC